jgi:hypothetical protein
MTGESILLIGCTLLVGAYVLIGFSSGLSSSSFHQPGTFFWCGVSISGLGAFLSPILRSLMTGTVNEEHEKDVHAITLLGGIAAVESFCDFAVPFIYGFGLWDWLVTIGKAPLIFLLGSFWYILAGSIVLVKLCRR